MVGLADLGEINRGRSRHRPRYAPHLYGGPYPFIQTGDVKASDGLITRYEQTYSEAGLAQSRLWPAGTMCITIAANIAETGILTFPACFPDSIVGFIPEDSMCDVRFVQYMFRYLKAGIQHRASGSVQDNINLAVLERIRFPAPPLHEQQAIAGILGALDDKIELNRRLNETLEAMARAIFKSWFVNFDPVRSKSEGVAPWGLDAATAGMFPDDLAPSELGEIPRGWSLDRYVNVGEVTYGYPFKSGVFNDKEGMPVLRIRDLPNHMSPTLTTEQVGEGYVVLPRDVVIGMDGEFRAYYWRGDPSLLNQRVCRVRPSQEEIPPSYLYFAIQRPLAAIEQGQVGTTVIHLGKKDLDQVQVVRPEPQVLRRFGELTMPILDRIISNARESRLLASVRDALLPKLLSGEIRLSQAESIAGAAF